MEAAFRLAVDMVNDDKQTLVRTRLTATPELIPHGDSFKASQKGITSLDVFKTTATKNVVLCSNQRIADKYLLSK